MFFVMKTNNNERPVLHRPLVMFMQSFMSGLDCRSGQIKNLAAYLPCFIFFDNIDCFINMIGFVKTKYFSDCHV